MPFGKLPGRRNRTSRFTQRANRLGIHVRANGTEPNKRPHQGTRLNEFRLTTFAELPTTERPVERERSGERPKKLKREDQWKLQFEERWPAVTTLAKGKDPRGVSLLKTIVEGGVKIRYSDQVIAKRLLREIYGIEVKLPRGESSR